MSERLLLQCLEYDSHQASNNITAAARRVRCSYRNLTGRCTETAHFYPRTMAVRIFDTFQFLRCAHIVQCASPRSDYASSKHASVLVLLYERDGIIHVLLTTRSKALRTHAGQTALPGGKVDDTDTDIIHTAVSSRTTKATTASLIPTTI